LAQAIVVSSASNTVFGSALMRCATQTPVTQPCLKPQECTVDLSGLSQNEAVMVRELVRQVVSERYAGSRPRLSVLAALAAMPHEGVVSMVNAVNADMVLKEADDSQDDVATTEASCSSSQDCSTPSVSGSEESVSGDGPTTVMLKCLGRRDTVYTIRTLLDAAGFAGYYDYLYVPVLHTDDPADQYNNRFGFAVVNFVDCETADAFRQAVAAQVGGTSVKKLQASWARVQGAEDNLEQVKDRRRAGKLPGTLFDGMVPWVFCGVDCSTGCSVGRPLQIEC